MNQNIWAQVRTRIMDAKTGEPVRDWSAWQKNLVFDSSLTNLLAGSPSFASMINACKIGSSTAKNEFVDDTITYTQSGNTITASTNPSFFTAGLIGAIFKYGNIGTSSGAEQYITGVGTNTLTVSGPGMSVGSATKGAVWMVAQTGLTTPLTALSPGGCATTTKVTAPGNCGTFFNGNTITLLRTFQFSTKTTPYTVNEIGYGDDTSGNNATGRGRVLLVTPDTVTTAQFYVVQIAISYTVSPGSPTAVNNVGLGINTQGTAVWQVWDCRVVDTSGNTQSFQGGAGTQNIMDGGSYGLVLNTSTAPTLNSTVAQAQAADFTFPYRAGAGSFAVGSMAINATTGFAQASSTASVSLTFTTAGETVNTLVIGGQPANGIWGIFLLNLDNPFTLPNGAFQASFTFQKTTSRTLINGQG